MGRTLHTAKVITEVLVRHGFSVNAIQPDETLGEVANFSWALFEPLMNGGTITFHGESFGVKKSDTNPFNLGYPDYFIQDAAHRIPKKVKDAWPKGYADTVDSFERFVDVTKRFLSRISLIAKTEEEGHFILVSHDCASMYLADRYTDGRRKGLVPGTFISIKCHGRRLVVTRVGDITDGNNETDFFFYWQL